MVRAGIYVRISQDREAGGLGVERQEEDCRELCRKRGWKVVEVYKDNDVSAYSGKPRPAWNRIVKDAKDHQIDAIVGWHVDRLTRSPIELEGIIGLAEDHKIKLATAKAGEIDLETPSGRMVARMLGAAARAEVERSAERQRAARRQAAYAGKPAKGGGRAFGYEEDRVTIRSDEAAIIREATKRVLARESLTNIVRDFQERDIRTTAGNHFKITGLRQLLASARISGRREYKPRSNNDRGTRPLVGEITCVDAWPGIISVSDSDRLRALLGNKKYDRGTGRKYLLSGILRCGVCGLGMSGRPKGDVPRYVCPNTPGTAHCGKLATVAARTDEHVRDIVLVALATTDLTEQLRKRAEVDPELPQAIADDENQLDELAEAWASKQITMSEWSSARRVIEGRLEDNKRRLAQVTETTPLLDLSGDYGQLVDRWENDLGVIERRAVVSCVLDHIVVAPADPRKKWDPERFEPVWRL